MRKLLRFSFFWALFFTVDTQSSFAASVPSLQEGLDKVCETVLAEAFPGKLCGSAPEGMAYVMLLGCATKSRWGNSTCKKTILSTYPALKDYLAKPNALPPAVTKFLNEERNLEEVCTGIALFLQKNPEPASEQQLAAFTQALCKPFTADMGKR